MIFRIEYYIEGTQIGSQPWKAATLPDAIGHAERQMMIQKADFARLRTH